jgi:uncharacterized protein
MLDRLPERIEPVGLADAGRAFRGEIAVERCERLAPLLADHEGALQVELVFERDERCVRVLGGKLTGRVKLICQRCLQVLEFPLDLVFRLGIVRSDEEIDRLPEGYEPLLVSGNPLFTVEVLEDEILLAIPAVPVHGDGQSCKLAYTNTPVVERVNPFSVLGKLKT